MEERETMEGGGDGGEAGEAGGQKEEADSDKSDEITQRILNIMANFLEGEVILSVTAEFSPSSLYRADLSV